MGYIVCISAHKIISDNDDNNDDGFFVDVSEGEPSGSKERCNIYNRWQFLAKVDIDHLSHVNPQIYVSLFYTLKMQANL